MREMKESGVPWIGAIPMEWGCSKIKYNISITNGSDPITEGDIPVYGSGVTSFKTCGEYKVGPTVLIGRKGATLHIPHYIEGRYWNVDTAFDTKPKGVFSIKYFYYLACSFDYKRFISQTTLPSMTQSCYENMVIPCPSAVEQRRIAEFLDSKCVEIDSISEKTRASIEEYKKLKQSVISEAVTKGIRGKRPMKDSGVECIGEIPEEWMVCRIKHVLTPGKEGIKIGPFGSALTNNVEGEGPFKIYGQWNIVNKDFSAGKNYVSKETFEVLGSYMVFTGDVLISMMGTIGKCAIIPNGIQPGIMDSHVIKARLNNSLMLDRYFELVFDKDNSVIIFEQMQKGKKGSIMDGLNSSIVKNLVIPCPPIAEQQEIAAYLDEKCAAIDSLIASKESLITELEAYKKSIIYEYVTGKKEVPAV